MDEQIQVVLAVLNGELSLAERHVGRGVLGDGGTWRDRFVDAVASPTSRP